MDKSEIAARKLIIQEVERHVKDCYPEAVVNQFGSYPGGLSIYCSDLDLSMDNISPTTLAALASSQSGTKTNAESTKDGDGKKPGPSRKSTKMMAVDILKPLIIPLKEDRLVRSILFVKHARVPLVKATFKCDIVADISCDSASTVGAKVLRILSERHGSALNDLSLFLKVYLRQQKLDEPFTGGLGSYRLYVMLSAHIERNPLYMKDPQNPDLGGLLLSFLQYYSNAKLFPKNAVIKVNGADPLIFDDPELTTRLHKAFSAANSVLTRPAAFKKVTNLDAEKVTEGIPPVDPAPALPGPNDIDRISHLAKVINTSELSVRRRISSKACAAFLTKAASMGIVASNPLSKYLRTIHNGVASGLSSPIVGSALGATRAYSMSSRNYSYPFPCSEGTLVVPTMLRASHILPNVHKRFIVVPSYANGNFAQNVGFVYRRLYQLKLLR